MNFSATYYQPDDDISTFVSTYWLVENSGNKNNITSIPDAFFELVLSKDEDNEFEIWLLGLGTVFEDNKEMPATKMFGISFKLIASEYIFGQPIADIKNSAKKLPEGFWGFDENDLQDITQLIEKVNNKIKESIPGIIDLRKKRLFEILYQSKGAISVKELAEQSCWSSRQINRYFNHQFDISLKSYCNILRFRSSFEHLKKGKLFPEQNFSDQAHFIREVKKLSGVSPKKISKNENDRFIQFSTKPKK
ncbi:transcriptional regulator [Sphingobacterium siyangense]|uniref:Transcriptional regulator n=1 Tax=Sphingobacterium siyangense TaxID=459529 RepID=A0A420FWT2_9SPHI|nr:transcriptional regulator [Sphingobacterium siyangense]